MRDLEETLDCNGVCQTGIFYYFKSVLNPPPVQQWLHSFTSIIEDKTLGIGIVLMFSFALTIVVNILAFPLCCKYCKAQESKEKLDA